MATFLPIERIIQGVNYSAVAFGLSLAGAIYGYFYLSILLLFLSGVAITKESIRLREPDFIFIAVTSLMLLISVTSAYGRDAYYEFLPLGFIYALSVYIFFIIKANYNHIHQTLGVVTVCFVISSFDLILGVLTKDTVTSLELIEQSITAAFVVPNDYALFVIAMPLFSYSLKSFPIGIKRWLIPFLYITGLITAASLNSRLCLLLLLVSLAVEYRLYTSFMKRHVIALLILIAILSVILTPDFFDKVQSLPTSRIPLWDAAIHQIARHPWLGMGLDSFSDFYANHISATSYSDLITVDRRLMPWPHNIFLEISASFGLLVAALFAAGMIALFTNYSTLSGRFGFSIRSTACLFILAGLVELTYLRIYPVLIVVFLASVQVAHASKQVGSE